MENGYPGSLKKMMQEGKTIECQVTMQYRNYTDKKDGRAKRILEAKYLNLPRTEINIKDFDFDAVLGGKTSPPTKAETVKEDLPEGADDFKPDDLVGEQTPI